MKKRLTLNLAEVDRYKTITRRLEQRVDELQPPMADAELSARSFSENTLIEIRDNAIIAGKEQIAVLTKEHASLGAQLDDVEAEVTRLQNVLVSKEVMLNKAAVTEAKLMESCAKLERELVQLRGREAAIAVSTKQNQHLLTLLQQEESKHAAAVAANEALETSYKHLKTKYTNLLRESADVDAVRTVAHADLERKANEVAAARDALRVESDAFRASHTIEMKNLRVRVGMLEGELASRVEKQYSLVAALEVAENGRIKASDECEGMKATISALKRRVEELVNLVRG